jgi:hypothetical protein
LGATGNFLTTAATDLDGDGDLDVLSASDDLIWYINNLASPAWLTLGDGLAGALGTPVLSGSGTMADGQTVTLSLTQALPGSLAALVVGDGPQGLPFKGGVLVPEPDAIFLGLPVDGAGELSISATWPVGVPVGAMFWFQYWISDFGGPAGLAASNGITGTVVT